MEVNKEHQEKITKHLNDLYESEKSSKFVLHLIRSYMPIYKTEKAFDRQEKSNCRCALCRIKLFTVTDLFNAMNNDEYRNNFSEFLIKSIKEPVKVGDHPLKKALGNGKIAFTGKDTSTFLCIDCAKVLFDWTINRLLYNDGKISWLTNKMQKEQFINHIDTFANEHPEKTNPTEIYTAKKVINYEKKSQKYKHKEEKKPTFGDLEVLKNLRDKMVSEDKN